MLRVVHGNRFEELADALIASLPAVPDPFAPTTIVVSRGVVGTWLQYRIAERTGVACGIATPFLDKFVTAAYVDDDARRAGLEALSKTQLAAVIASVLADPDRVGEPALARVRDYLGDPARPDAPVRRVQLAHRVAELYWQYAMTRPEWLAAWDVGSPAIDGADARWQARLWSLVGDHLARSGRAGAAVIPRLWYARRKLGLAPPRLDRPVHVVGFTYLAPAYLAALDELAGTDRAVAIYIVDPCAEYWEDVRKRQADVLGLWGTPIRDTVARLIELGGGDLDARFAEPAADTALARLLHDAARRSDAPDHDVPPAATPGVAILACPSVRRELEVIGTEIVRLLERTPDLRAHDIALLVAGDPDPYLAQLPSVWGSLLGHDDDGDGVPFHVVDSQLAQHGRVGEAVQALLDLPIGRFTRRELLGLMTHPCVLARHPHVEPADWVQWTERLGIVHGGDRYDHRGTYLEGLDLFHWDQGILRLALGGFMRRDREMPPVALGSRTLVPEEIAADRQASAATFALLARSLIGDARWLRDLTLPLARWATVLDAMVTTYVAPPDDAGERELARVRGQITGLAELDLDGREVAFREVACVLRHRLGALLGDRGEPLARGVMVAPLAPMRPLPFRVVFVAGLGEGAFPSSDPPSPLDLRQTKPRPPEVGTDEAGAPRSSWRAGDVSRRDRDRVAFFDAVLAARDALYLSHVALDPASGETVAPSSVVLELGDVLARYLGVASGAEALDRITTRHPLHRWDPRYDHDLVPVPAPARARERRAIAIRDAVTRHLQARGWAQPDPGRLRELIAWQGPPAPRDPDDPFEPRAEIRYPVLAELARDLRIEPVDVQTTAERDDAPVRISLATLRRFVEAPVQAWAIAVLRLDDLPDEDVVDRSDEPFGLGNLGRAAVLRDALAGALAGTPVGDAHAAAVGERMNRGAAPVGVFGEVAAEGDRELIETWIAAVGPRLRGPARRLAFGRTTQVGAGVDLQPAIVLDAEIAGRRRRVELVGQTEVVAATDGGLASIVVAGGTVASRHTLRGAFDQLAIAAAGVVPEVAGAGHVTLCLDGKGVVHETRHTAWTTAGARDYLGGLVGELLAEPHGYVLSLGDLDAALAGKPVKRKSGRNGDPGSLGFGPIERADRLDLPPDPEAIARRRLAPLVERMSGKHHFDSGAR